MTEEDTFNRLKRWDYKTLVARWFSLPSDGYVDAHHFWSQHSLNRSGWTFNEFAGEYARRSRAEG